MFLKLRVFWVFLFNFFYRVLMLCYCAAKDSEDINTVWGLEQAQYQGGVPVPPENHLYPTPYKNNVMYFSV